MGCPSGVTDAHGCLDGAICNVLCQGLQPAFKLSYGDTALMIHGKSCGVIAAIFQLAKTVQQNIRALSVTYISNDSTHVIIS